eukprot:CAMPEP_0119038630 /NCGR_PEP_ID=MMETSP1177-20130426/7674_1 /TAXON_ID=2985 /ORGANISM="Ochromonas sp, Strain CCMP1899" /LENGTH=438 /DNA_ID=CAMNT_0007001473 /DNA_START=264 /DNA_END=1577 /DNA_ORIENTATION=-
MENEGHQLFQGYIGRGGGFRTKKGFRGMKLEASWSKHILESFKKDDEELLEVALSSCLCDVHARVIGGEFGTPLSIGEHGFFSQNQFEGQSELLKRTERVIVERTKSFLSDHDWKIIDSTIDQMGKYSFSRFVTASPGDTFTALAVVENAFLVANILLIRGVDPLIENNCGKDLFCKLKQQYATLTIKLRELQEEKLERSSRMCLPSEVKDLKKKLDYILDSLEGMTNFIDSLISVLKNRIIQIDQDIVEKRRADKMDKVLSDKKIWNTTLMPLVKTRLEECIELKDYIHIKLKKYLDADAGSVNDYTASIMEEHDTLFGSTLSVRSSTQQDTSRSKISDITGSLLIGNTPRSKGDRIKALKDSMKESNKESNGYEYRSNSIMSKKPSTNTKTVSTLALHQGNQPNPQRFEAGVSGKSQITCQSIPEENLSVKSQITW